MVTYTYLHLRTSTYRRLGNFHIRNFLRVSKISWSTVHTSTYTLHHVKFSLVPRLSPQKRWGRRERLGKITSELILFWNHLPPLLSILCTSWLPLHLINRLWICMVKTEIRFINFSQSSNHSLNKLGLALLLTNFGHMLYKDKQYAVCNTRRGTSE